MSKITLIRDVTTQVEFRGPKIGTVTVIYYM